MQLASNSLVLNQVSITQPMKVERHKDIKCLENNVLKTKTLLVMLVTVVS